MALLSLDHATGPALHLIVTVGVSGDAVEYKVLSEKGTLVA
jgi:hypothetical protein